MEQISRLITPLMKSNIGRNKILLLYGARRVGKTHILRSIHQSGQFASKMMNGEDSKTAALLSERSVSNYAELLGENRLLLIDEAQVIPEIGKILKLMIDEFPDLTIIASGSSSFDLAYKAGEPLVGRSITFQLFPVSQSELKPYEDLLQTRENLESRLIYGTYPEVVNLAKPKDRVAYLQDLVEGYLLKDLLMFDAVKNAAKLKKLLILLAYQVGNEVKYEELGTQLGMSRNTVERYLDLLTKVFIIHPISAFSSNLRKEVTKPCKWYFNDNGLRNGLIGEFKQLAIRQDVGQLWENYVFMERKKQNHYLQLNKELFFWRTYDGQEIDFIEKDRETGQIHAFEAKWNKAAKHRLPNYFKTNYPDVEVEVIHNQNYLNYISKLNTD